MASFKGPFNNPVLEYKHTKRHSLLNVSATLNEEFERSKMVVFSDHY